MTRTIARAVTRGIAWGVLLCTLGLGALVIIIPAVAGATPLTVLTGSMEPGLPPGTLVIVKPTPAADIRLGDVVTYQRESDRPELVTHRVIEVHSLSDGSFEFVTMGDANDAPDPTPIVEEQLQGRVWYSVPLIGWITTGAVGQFRAWLIPATGIGLIAFAVGSVISTVLETRSKRRAKATERETTTAQPLEDSPIPA